MKNTNDTNTTNNTTTNTTNGINGSNILGNEIAATKHSLRTIKVYNTEIESTIEATVVVCAPDYLEYNLTNDLNNNIVHLRYIKRGEHWEVELTDISSILTLGRYEIHSNTETADTHKFYFEGNQICTYHSSVRGVTAYLLRHYDILNWFLQLKLM